MKIESFTQLSRLKQVCIRYGLWKDKCKVLVVFFLTFVCLNFVFAVKIFKIVCLFPRIVVKKYHSLHDFNPYSGSLRFALDILIWFYSLWILLKEEMFSSSHVWYSFSDCILSSFLKHLCFQVAFSCQLLSEVSNSL